jgi:hypothetical protein
MKFSCKFVALLFVTIIYINGFAQRVSKSDKTSFQTSHVWEPYIDSRADIAMVYGVEGNPSDRHEGRQSTFLDRVNSWREKGYNVQFMTGIAWGEYQDYFMGKWDGKCHLDEGQKTACGDTIWHGAKVPYIVPSVNYLKYFEQRNIKSVIDGGITSIYLEEPEFWARSGYSEAFKKEWVEYYGFPWRPQDASPENTYLSNKLKYYLYYRALRTVFDYAKKYGKSKGLDIKCYVATHSLINYSQWQIISPEASLASLPCVDGYIAQVWTGTSREPNYYNGQKAERVFENAFLEYGCMQSMTAPSHRRIYFLTDPVEDWARDWSDYKNNYQATFTAQLFYPAVNHYEIMPWPERIYEGLYEISARDHTKGHIPRSYSTQMQIMQNALQSMPLSHNRVSGTNSIGVLMSNSLMFQRSPRYSDKYDPQLSNFYGMSMPLIKRGIPVHIVHMENLGYRKSLLGIKVLLMTYSNMKPMNQRSHVQLVDWVRNGGTLVYISRDDDPFQNVREWWNTDNNKYARPADELFGRMGIKGDPSEGYYPYGKGLVCVLRNNPEEYVMTVGGDKKLIETIADLYHTRIKKERLVFKNNFMLRRGAYLLSSVMKESVSGQPLVFKGKFIDLFNPDLPVLEKKIVLPGTQSLLYDLSAVKNPGHPEVVASACRIYQKQSTHNQYSFMTEAPINTTIAMRILLPRKPKLIKLRKISGEEIGLNTSSWDKKSRTLFISFESQPSGVHVLIDY